MYFVTSSAIKSLLGSNLAALAIYLRVINSCIATSYSKGCWNLRCSVNFKVNFVIKFLGHNLLLLCQLQRDTIWAC